MAEKDTMRPPLQLKMKDDEGHLMENAGFLDKTYKTKATVLTAGFEFTSDSEPVNVTYTRDVTPI